MQNQSLGRLIPLTSIQPSSTNPRKRFNDTELQELAESIKQHGVMQPILVRPTNLDEVKNGTDNYFMYEIVAGERRYRASKLAGQDSIPAIERELSDLETLQLQIIENLQRSDLHPLEEAQGFKALLDNKDAKSWNADELAAKIGKSRSYIYGSLKLNDLCTYAQDMFLDGKFGREIALLVARIPGAKLQEKAVKEIMSREFSYRTAKDFIRFQFTFDLTKAPWDKISTTLYPAAGSCLSCPKRTGNYPELYPDIESADVCTDTACYAAKKVAYAKEVIESNPRAIYGDQAKEIAPYGANHYVTKDFTTDPKRISLYGHNASDLLGDDLPQPYVLVDDKSQVQQIYKTEEVETALKQKLEEKIASGEIVIQPTLPTEKSDYEIAREAKEKKQAEESQRRIHIFNRLAPLISKDHINVVIKHAITQFCSYTSADLQPILDLHGFEGTEEEFFKSFTQEDHDLIGLSKMLALVIIAPGIEVSRWDWKSEEDNEHDDDYQFLLKFISDLGFDLSQFLTTELPLTPDPAAQAQELTAESNAAADDDATPELPAKLQAIKNAELAKRAKRAQKQLQKESANADA